MIIEAGDARCPREARVAPASQDARASGAIAPGRLVAGAGLAGNAIRCAPAMTGAARRGATRKLAIPAIRASAQCMQPRPPVRPGPALRSCPVATRRGHQPATPALAVKAVENAARPGIANACARSSGERDRRRDSPPPAARMPHAIHAVPMGSWPAPSERCPQDRPAGRWLARPRARMLRTVPGHPRREQGRFLGTGGGTPRPGGRKR
jgi:hypothetical protein